MAIVSENTTPGCGEAGSGSSGALPWGRADVACVVGIVLLSAVFFAPTIAERPLTTTHDAKAGLIARRMFEEGRWFVADIDVAPVNKPPLYYWLVAGISALAGGVSEWTIRLPGLLSCIGAAVLTWAFARRLWDRWTGVVSAAALVTMIQFHGLAQTSRLDSVVMLTVLSAVFCFWRALVARGGARNRRSWAWSVTAYVSLAVGVAAKGPIAMALAGLVVAAILAARRVTREGELRDDLVRLHFFSGILIVAALTGPVFYGMERASSGRFLRFFIMREHLARMGVPVDGVEKFHKGYSFFYYFKTIWAYAAPWSVFLPAAMAAAAAAYRRKSASRTAALLPILYFSVPFLFLSVVSIKKWAYLTLVFPPAALLCGRLWTELMRGRLREIVFVTWSMRVVAVFGLLLAVAGAAGLVVLVAPGALSAVAGPDGLIHTQEPAALPWPLAAIVEDGWTGMALAGALALGVGVSGASILRRRFTTAFAALVVAWAAGLLCYSLVIEPVSGLARSQRGFARRAEDWLARHETPRGARVYVCAGEPYELLFHLGARAHAIPFAEAEEFIERIRPADSPGPGTPAWLIIDRESFEELTGEVGRLPALLATAKDESCRLPMVLTEVKLTRVEPAPSSEDARAALTAFACGWIPLTLHDDFPLTPE